MQMRFAAGERRTAISSRQLRLASAYWGRDALLEQHLEVGPIIAAGQPAEATLDRAQGSFADPECQQRTEDQAKRTTKRCTKREQQVAGVLVVVHNDPSLDDHNRGRLAPETFETIIVAHGHREHMDHNIAEVE